MVRAYLLIWWCVATAMPVDDDPTLISLLRSANAQHLSQCASGSMNVLRRTEYPDSGNFTELKGKVEWDEDYLYFDGSIAQDMDGKSVDVRNSTLVNSRVFRFARIGQQAFGWLHTDPDPIHNVDEKDWAVVFPFSQLQKSRVDQIAPSPVDMLTTFDGFEAEYPSELLAENPKTRRGTPFKRDVTREGSRVTIRSEYQHGMECEAVFDLDQGGLCVSRETLHSYMSPDRIEQTTRRIAMQTPDFWVPVQSTFESRAGSVSSDPLYVATLEITEFQPLVRRKAIGNVAREAFGPLPQSTDVLEVNEVGKTRSYKVNGEVKEDLESQLLDLSRQVRRSGLGRPGE